MTRGKLLYVLNTIYCCTMLVGVFFASLFYLGSKERFQTMIGEHAITYFFQRLCFDLMFVVACLIIVAFFNFIIIKLFKITDFLFWNTIITLLLVNIGFGALIILSTILLG